MDNRKNQHYVPKFYLREWCIPGTELVFVYDKEKGDIRKSNIENVAAVNYFYDFKLIEFLSEDTIQKLNARGILCNGRLQTIEKRLSNNLEGPFSGIFADIISKAREATPWHIKECFFISPEMKETLSVYLAFQLIRTRKIRKGIMDSANKLAEFCKKLDIPDSQVEKVKLSEEGASRIHNRMLLDKDGITKFAYLFYRLTWVLGINKTKQLFYTSDNPIGMQGHNKNRSPFIGTGLASCGVEVFYPISPDLILIMVDGDYHKHLIKDDRRYIEFVSLQTIEYYNSLIMKNAERCIIGLQDFP